jgi:hypothetical protein
MYLSTITGNVINKFNNQKINVLYEPQRNFFDIILAQCGFTLFFDKQYGFFETVKNNIVLLDNSTIGLNNYNVGITNNIIGYTSNKFFSSQHLNTLIFTHSYRPGKIKKEDLLLMSNNLSREKKVFFSQDVSDSWNMFNNKVIIKYGIPTDILYSSRPTEERTEDVLILNFENSQNAESLAGVLESNGIKINLIKDLTGDLNAIRELLNRYKVVIDFNEHNIINILCAISCGCSAVTYMGDMLSNNYINTPNLFSARSVQDLISSTKQALSHRVTISTEYIHENYSFDTFKDNISKLIIAANNEAFVL